MARFAVSILATNLRQRVNHHTCGMIEAVSVPEAVGLALPIARKLYPPSDGWRDHDVIASPDDNVITLEHTVLLPDE